MYKTVLIVLMLMLNACGQIEQSKIEKVILSSLSFKDPDSAKFRNLIIDKYNNRACVEFNAKNGFGGYGDWETVSLVKDSAADSSWILSRVDKVRTERFCSFLGVNVDVNAIREKAVNDASKIATETVQKVKHISSQEAQKICDNAIGLDAFYHGELAVAKALDNKEDINIFEKFLEEYSIDNASCLKE
jgi:pyridoxal/pyridoxine/pyridoxamine kinase